ncbi:MAG: methylmalonyl-CoA epimerase [Parafilimonas sp.]|nr:methylmalonyl-CoA epimerase [Parafilimonas sp.]
MKNIDHIGIAVKNIDASVLLFEKLLNTSCYKKESVNGESVITAFLKTGETKIELIQDENNNGVINKYIEKKGEGIHHIAFEVENIYDEISRLKEAGFALLNEIPKKGADNKLICFLHPKSSNGVLVELCQEIKADT